MKVYLIRHGKTAGNQEARYVGSTDESILEEERTRLVGIHYPEVDAVYASPRKRCLETTELLYPNHTPVIVNDLAECDFGAFEYKNYKELSGDPDYQAWIDSGGTIGFPGGESREQFQNPHAARVLAHSSGRGEKGIRTYCNRCSRRHCDGTSGAYGRAA